MMKEAESNRIFLGLQMLAAVVLGLSMPVFGFIPALLWPQILMALLILVASPLWPWHLKPQTSLLALLVAVPYEFLTTPASALIAFSLVQSGLILVALSCAWRSASFGEMMSRVTRSALVAKLVIAGFGIMWSKPGLELALLVAGVICTLATAISLVKAVGDSSLAKPIAP